MMRRPLLLDLFCGGGGAAMGYHLAGFDVIGVDLAWQPDYPFAFVRGDAIEYARENAHRFDVLHASPPCQAFSITGNLARAQGKRASTVDLLAPTRDVMVRSGKPYVIENVKGAPLIDPVVLCGSSFGLLVRRHRLFESNLPLTAPKCDHDGQGRPWGVYGSPRDTIPCGGRTVRSLEHGQQAMGISWLPWSRLKEAVPPAYTEHLGGQIRQHLALRV